MRPRDWLPRRPERWADGSADEYSDARCRGSARPGLTLRVIAPECGLCGDVTHYLFQPEDTHHGTQSRRTRHTPHGHPGLVTSQWTDSTNRFVGGPPLEHTNTCAPRPYINAHSSPRSLETKDSNTHIKGGSRLIQDSQSPPQTSSRSSNPINPELKQDAPQRRNAQETRSFSFLSEEKKNPKQPRQHDDDAAHRTPLPEKLPVQRHGPLHRRRQQHGPDRHGAQHAAGRPAGGGPGDELPEVGRGGGRHVQLLPAAQVHPQGHRVGGQVRSRGREAQGEHEVQPHELLGLLLILLLLLRVHVLRGGRGRGRGFAEAVPVPPDRAPRGSVQAHGAGHLPDQALQAGGGHRGMGPVSPPSLHRN